MIKIHFFHERMIFTNGLLDIKSYLEVLKIDNLRLVENFILIYWSMRSKHLKTTAVHIAVCTNGHNSVRPKD